MEGLAKHQAGNPRAALLAYRRILSRDPDFVPALCNAAFALLDLGEGEEAMGACRRALELDPAHPLALCAHAQALKDAGDLDGALARYRESLARDPDSVAALEGLAGILARRDRLEEALAADDRALSLAPGDPSLAANRGETLLRMGRVEEAALAFRSVLERAPDHPQARWNLACARLSQGEYRDAWTHFGARLELPEAAGNRREFPQPRWDGSPFQGTLLVWAEQGFGDTIQFARFLPRAKALGGRVVLEVWQGLDALMGTLEGPDQVVARGGPLPPFDRHIPLLDLPTLFRPALEEIPRRGPYLDLPRGYRPGPGLEAGLGNPGRRPRVGLVWSGKPSHPENPRRSIPPELLAPLAAVPASWFSLQVGQGGTPPLPGLTALGGHFRDFADTAYALKAMDLLITVDTSVAHLAGALGVPTLLLLCRFPDWRWLMEGETCPWYPSMRVFRQPQPGHWVPVVEAVLAHLAGFARGT
jgi:Flp pilus assembly protein TadD